MLDILHFDVLLFDIFLRMEALLSRPRLQNLINTPTLWLASVLGAHLRRFLTRYNTR